MPIMPTDAFSRPALPAASLPGAGRRGPSPSPGASLVPVPRARCTVRGKWQTRTHFAHRSGLDRRSSHRPGPARFRLDFRLWRGHRPGPVRKASKSRPAVWRAVTAGQMAGRHGLSESLGQKTEAARRPARGSIRPDPVAGSPRGGRVKAGPSHDSEWPGMIRYQSMKEWATRRVGRGLVWWVRVTARAGINA
jgi:hypothetical protein